jgi:hypothetical protein
VQLEETAERPGVLMKDKIQEDAYHSTPQRYALKYGGTRTPNVMVSHDTCPGVHSNLYLMT